MLCKHYVNKNSEDSTHWVLAIFVFYLLFQKNFEVCCHLIGTEIVATEEGAFAALFVDNINRKSMVNRLLLSGCIDIVLGPYGRQCILRPYEKVPVILHSMLQCEFLCRLLSIALRVGAHGNNTHFGSITTKG